MVYADYTYYQVCYGGSSLELPQFIAAARRASAYIDMITWGRLKRGWPVTEDVRMACCALADVIGGYQAMGSLPGSGSAGVASFNNDGYSETYASAEAVAVQFEADQQAAINLYLSPGHPLRYAGGDPTCSCATSR